MKKTLMTFLYTMILMFCMVFSANALNINANYYNSKIDLNNDTPELPLNYYIGKTGEDATLNWWWGKQRGVGSPGSVNYSQHSSPAIAYLTGDSEELYKSDVANDASGDNSTGIDSKYFANYYKTTFTPGSNPNDATIVFTGSKAIAGATHLFVKDGNQTPVWYLFDISVWNWDGKQGITLENFWANGQGGISHVSIYGNNGTPIPEPTTMLLFGTGLIGLAWAGRRKMQRNNDQTAT